MGKVRIHITGKVQGVFFRHSARQEAKSLQISGWVKNLPDGSVLCEAAGNESSLKAFINWCQKGPPRAQVAHASVELFEDENPLSYPVDFEIIS